MLIVVAVAAIGGAQATYVEECPEGSVKYDGPLASHTPIKYDVEILVDTRYERDLHTKKTVTIVAQTDFSKSPEDPKDVIVLHVGENIAVRIDSVSVKMESPLTAFRSDFEQPIVSACRDTKKQLMLVKVGGQGLGHWSDKYKIVMTAWPNADSKREVLDLHRVPDTRLIQADFSNKQAHFIIPCFDDPKYRAAFKLKVKSTQDFEIKSNVLQEEKSVQSMDKVNKNKMSKIKFYRTVPVSFDELLFSMNILD